jgi:outer membrane receptor for monomeric catechols
LAAARLGRSGRLQPGAAISSSLGEGGFSMPRYVPLAIGLILVLAVTPEAFARKRKAHASDGAPSPAENGYLTPYLTGPNSERKPIMEVPGSATVINRQILDDQQATTLGQALRNVSGVTVRH